MAVAKSLADVHYIITIAGLYYTQAPKGENVHNYEIDVPMTHKQIEDPLHSPISLFKHHYAETMMPRKYPGYQGLYSHEIVKVKCTEPSRLLENTKLMNMRQLCRYIQSHGLPIRPDLHEDVGSLRTAINDYNKDAEGFMKVQKIAEERKGPVLKKQLEADRMLALYGEEYINGALTPKTEFEDDLVGV